MKKVIFNIILNMKREPCKYLIANYDIYKAIEKLNMRLETTTM